MTNSRALFGHDARAVAGRRHSPLVGVSGAGLQPSDDTSALDNLDVVAVDQRFDFPDNVRVLIADEDAAASAPCVRLRTCQQGARHLGNPGVARPLES
jgi:hypothetical protein